MENHGDSLASDRSEALGSSGGPMQRSWASTAPKARVAGGIPLVHSITQWEFQDPKMEVLYHIRPYFVGIFTYIGLI